MRMLVFPSMGGWGVRETVFVVLLKPYLEIEEAIAVSIAYYAVNLATSLLGGLILLTKGWPKVEWSRYFKSLEEQGELEES